MSGGAGKYGLVYLGRQSLTPSGLVIPQRELCSSEPAVSQMHIVSHKESQKGRESDCIKTYYCFQQSNPSLAIKNTLWCEFIEMSILKYSSKRYAVLFLH